MSMTNERLVFIDLETGGLELTRPIIQIAAVAVDRSLKELETFEVKIRFNEFEVAREVLRKNHYDRAVWLFQEHQHLTAPHDYRLTTLCEYFGVPLRKCDAHDALVDVRATVQLYRVISEHSLIRRKTKVA